MLNPSIPILSRFPSISDFLARSGFQHHLIASSGFQRVEVLPQWDKRKKDDPMILSVGGKYYLRNISSFLVGRP